MNPLTPTERERLARLLSSTLADDAVELDDLVSIATGEGLFRSWVARGLAFEPTVRTLLERLGEQGQLTPFLRLIYVRRPFREDVRKALTTLDPNIASAAGEPVVSFSTQNAGQERTDGSSVVSGLQRIVRREVAFIDPEILLAFVANAERRVCRLERRGAALGTGFLVGPATVLTNWHVVKAVTGNLFEVGCRFGYLCQSDGSRLEGVVAPLHAEALLSHRPYAPAEMTSNPDAPPPLPSELDYALLQLAEPLDDARGWFALKSSAQTPPVGSPLVIVQHPDGKPMKIAIDTAAILAVPADRPRFRYATNTEGGSSGSPCFNQGFELVGLHHYGDPVWPPDVPARFNQGVPIGLIRSDIVSRGLERFLGD